MLVRSAGYVLARNTGYARLVWADVINEVYLRSNYM